MLATLRITILASLTPSLLVGCASTRDVVTATPTVDELPDLRAMESTLPVDVGIEGAADQPRIVLVAPLPEPELTPEERAILGLDQDQGYDPLELYRPWVGLEQGIDPLAPCPLTGVGGGFGGGSVGLAPYTPPMGVGSGWAGAAPGVAPFIDRPVRTGSVRRAPAGIGPRAEVNVGNIGAAPRPAASYPPGKR
jgi:hypothetical protein